MMAWRAAFSATSRSASSSSRAEVQTGRPLGSTNSPSTVSSRLRALAAPSSWRRVTNGPSTASTPLIVTSRDERSPPAPVLRSGAAPHRRTRHPPRAPGPCPAPPVSPPAAGPRRGRARRRTAPARPRPAARPGPIRAGRSGAARCRGSVAHLLAQPAVVGPGEPVREQPGGHGLAVGVRVADHIEHVVEPAVGRLVLQARQCERSRAGAPGGPSTTIRISASPQTSSSQP